MKKSVSVLLIAALLFCAFFGGCAVSPKEAVLYANAFGGEKNSPDTVISYTKSENELILFLPSDTDYSRLKIWGASGTKINGEAIKNGEDCPVLSSGGDYTLLQGKREYKLTVIPSGGVPSVFIETSSGSLDAIHADKTYKESGIIKVYENGSLTLDGSLDYIKGRGNQTWTGEKRPYNIKLSEKASLFGMERSKKWCLLANAGDDTLIRNTVALTLAQRMEIPFACDFHPVDLYINGDYRGNYLLTEKVEAGDGRVEIEDLDKRNEEANSGTDIDGLAKLTEGGHADCGNKRWTDIPVCPDDVSGGYLLEFDGETYYDKETNGFCTKRGQFVTVKSPEAAAKEELDYLYDFCCEAEEALASPDGKNALGRHYSEYFDVDALARLFVLNEYLLNPDAGFSSTFFSKQAGEAKLVAGPAWDFDACLHDDLTGGVRPLFKAENWCTNILCMNRYNYDTTVFELAFRHEDFRKAAGEQWTKYRELLTGEAFDALVRDSAGQIACSAAADHFRWASKVLVTPAEWTRIYRENVGVLSELAADRAVYMDKGLLGPSAMLYYDLNGASGWMFSEKIAVEGESVRVKELNENAFLPVEIPGETAFAGWNTQRDGSGDSYMPGEDIVLAAPGTVLYAQWSRE